MSVSGGVVPPNGITYYLSGPISGDIAGNVKRFGEAATALRERGYKVISPVEVCDDHLSNMGTPGKAQSWDWYMRRDIEAMLNDSVQGIIMLPGWEFSRGARLELQVARALNFTVADFAECLLREVSINA